MATKSPTQKARTKVLRIGLFQNNRIIEERLLRTPKPVTIGSALKRNTFVVPASNLPPRFTAFDFRDGRYWLLFDEKMSGRVKIDGQVMPLGDLIRQGKAQKNGSLYTVPLSPNSQGRVAIGEATLLFQFVTPPPPRPKPVLPPSMRGGFTAHMSPTLMATILLSALIQIGFVAFLELRDWPIPRDLEAQNLDRFVVLMEEEPDPEEPVDVEPVEDGEGEPVEEAPPAEAPAEKAEDDGGGGDEEEPEAAKGDDSPEARAAADAERRRRLAESVKNKTILGVIGAKTADGGGSVVDILKQGAGKTSMEEAFAGSQGIDTEAAGAERSGLRTGGGSAADGKGGTVGIGDLKASGAVAEASKGAGTGERRTTKVKARLNLKSPTETVGGQLDAGSISSAIKRRASKIRACYERHLKKDPKAGGKVIVQFEIGTAGRVTSARAANDSVGGGVGNCVAGVIKGIRFSRPKGGAVIAKKTFVFEAGS